MKELFSDSGAKQIKLPEITRPLRIDHDVILTGNRRGKIKYCNNMSEIKKKQKTQEVVAWILGKKNLELNYIQNWTCKMQLLNTCIYHKLQEHRHNPIFRLV
eukprot:425735_1